AEAHPPSQTTTRTTHHVLMRGSTRDKEPTQFTLHPRMGSFNRAGPWTGLKGEGWGATAFLRLSGTSGIVPSAPRLVRRLPASVSCTRGSRRGAARPARFPAAVSPSPRRLRTHQRSV